MDTELLVGNQVLFFGQVLVDLCLLGFEVQVVGKDTGPRIALPVERGIRVAITFHFFLSRKIPWLFEHALHIHPPS